MVTNNVKIHAEESVQNVGPSRIKISYQRIGDPKFPPVFLIMGAGAQMINWPEGFCMELASRGLHLIRFDNRDAGLSTHISDAPVPDFQAIQSGDFSTVTYTLSDMAADTVPMGFGMTVHLVGINGRNDCTNNSHRISHKVRSLTNVDNRKYPVGQPDYSVGSLGSPMTIVRHIDWQL